MVLVVFPSLYIQIALTVTLIVLGLQSTKKAIDITKQENAEAEQKKSEQAQQETGGSTEAEKTTGEGISSPNKEESGDAGKESKDGKDEEKAGDVDAGEKYKVEDEVNEGDENFTLQADPSKSATNVSVHAFKDPESDLSESAAEAEQRDRISQSLNLPKTGKILEEDDDGSPLDNIVLPAEYEEKELKQLKKVLTMEAGHGQWLKQGICIVLITELIAMNLCIGSSTRESIIGISKCNLMWWGIQAIFIITCVLATILAVRVAKQETALKQKFGNVGIAESDLDLNSTKMIYILLVLGFGGGFIAGCVGLGGGAIYNPMLITLGVPPAVSSATGLYLVFFSKIASCFVYYLNAELNLSYGFWIAFWSTVGMILGLLGA